MLLYLPVTYFYSTLSYIIFTYTVSYPEEENCLQITAFPSTYVSIKYVRKYVYYTNYLIKAGYIRFGNKPKNRF